MPGGKAAYPSSVLMNAVPAKVAGVRELVMASPNPNPLVLAAAALAGVDRVLGIGGAQAIGALAYGTKSIPRVDKIVGPGNAYVAEAKRQVFGEVGIDMVAGPSEILVIADGSAPADWVAMDLFSQAEHDESAQAILLSPDEKYLDAVDSLHRQAAGRDAESEVIAASLKARGALILTRDLEEACAVANRIAPEHLELLVDDAGDLAAEADARRRDLPRPLELGGDRRLLRRAEPRAADRRHGALLVAARRLRLPEANQRHRRFASTARRSWAASRRRWRRAKDCRRTRAPREMRFK